MAIFYTKDFQKISEVVITTLKNGDVDEIYRDFVPVIYKRMPNPTQQMFAKTQPWTTNGAASICQIKCSVSVVCLVFLECSKQRIFT